MGRKTLAVGFLIATACGEVRADASFLRLGMGGWGYAIKGTITNTAQLDFQDDLGLKPSDRKSYVLGFKPAQPGWLPTLEFDYTRIAADGQQTISSVPPGGSVLFGSRPISADSQVDNRTDINDFELTALWPYRMGNFQLSGGLKLAYLKGFVNVADQDTGQQQTQRVNELFPLASAAVEWQPLPELRLSFSGDYVQYKNNRADELEARVLWKIVGPLGLEAGYLRRRYKIIDPMNQLNARVGGVRLSAVIEIPY